MKSYCTQNNGDCFTCPLVNYGHDCENNLVDYSSKDWSDVFGYDVSAVEIVATAGNDPKSLAHWLGDQYRKMYRIGCSFDALLVWARQIIREAR